MKKSIVEILKEVLTEELPKSRWERNFDENLRKKIEENLEESELAEIQSLVVKMREETYSNLLLDETIKKMSLEDLKNVSEERLMRIRDFDWWKKLVERDESGYFVQCCPYLEIIQRALKNGRKIFFTTFYRRQDIPLELRARFFAKSRIGFLHMPFSVVVESFPYRDNSEQIVSDICELYTRVASEFKEIICKYLSDWPEDFIREYWKENIQFKKFALLSKHCPKDLINHALQLSNVETKAAALTNPNCPPSIRLKYSLDKFWSVYTNTNKTGKEFEDFIIT